jgi:hypothetical protein
MPLVSMLEASMRAFQWRTFRVPLPLTGSTINCVATLKVNKKSDTYGVFATPEDGSNKFMYVSDNLVDTFYKVNTPAHFDYVAAHPTVFDRVIGLDVDARCSFSDTVLHSRMQSGFRILPGVEARPAMRATNNMPLGWPPFYRLTL